MLLNISRAQYKELNMLNVLLEIFLENGAPPTGTFHNISEGRAVKELSLHEQT